MIFKKYFIYLIVFFFTNICHAHDDNVHINSSRLVFDKNNEIANFYGEVIIFFDDFVLKTSELQILYDNSSGKRVINKIIIPYNLIALKVIPENIIMADSAEYIAKSSELVLVGNIKLLHEGHILQTNKLSYYTKLRNIKNDNITEK